MRGAQRTKYQEDERTQGTSKPPRARGPQNQWSRVPRPHLLATPLTPSTSTTHDLRPANPTLSVGPITISHGERSFHVCPRGDVARYVDLVVVEPKPGASQKRSLRNLRGPKLVTLNPTPSRRPRPEKPSTGGPAHCWNYIIYIKILCTLNDVWEHAANNSESLSRMTCSEQSQTRCSVLVVLQRPECF